MLGSTALGSDCTDRVAEAAVIVDSDVAMGVAMAAIRTFKIAYSYFKGLAAAVVAEAAGSFGLDN